MKKLIIANWKLRILKERDAVRLARASDQKGVVVCPPFPFLSTVKKALKNAQLGAQDVFWEKRGAFTGEISGAMLKGLGVRYVIVGHSERRGWLHETDAMINKKVHAALKAGLTVILCVGEPLAVRRKGLSAAKKFVKNQLIKDLRGISPLISHFSRLVVAYEPLWAIGTGRADKPQDTVEMARCIRSSSALRFMLRLPDLPSATRRRAGDVRVLYGGSVNSQNATHFLQYKDVGGALVGGASVNRKEFASIIHAASRVS